MKVTIADLGVGNLHSLRKALTACGATATVESSPERWLDASALVLPGVGSFGAGAAALTPVKSELRELLNSGTPCLGVCLGMQLLLEQSEESPGALGLGIVRGTARRFSASTGIKVPHMGWTRVRAAPDALFEGIAQDSYFYFVHSYYPETDDTQVVAQAKHGAPFPCVLRSGNTVGAQFHPEKSGDPGLSFLRSWIQTAEAQA